MKTKLSRFAAIHRLVVFTLLASALLFATVGCGGPKREMEKISNKLSEKISSANNTLRLLDDGMMESGPANAKLDQIAFEIDSLEAMFNDAMERAYGKIPEEEINILRTQKEEIMVHNPL